LLILFNILLFGFVLKKKKKNSLKEDRDKSSSGADAESEAASLRFEIGKLEQALQESAEEALKYKQRLAKLEHKARRMTDVRIFLFPFSFFSSRTDFFPPHFQFASENRSHQEQNVSAFSERITRLSAENTQKDVAIAELSQALETKEDSLAKAYQQAHSANASLSAIQQEKTDLEMEV